jgi:hypothetical protein
MAAATDRYLKAQLSRESDRVNHIGHPAALGN